MEILDGLYGIVCLMYDIIVYGGSEAGHYTRLLKTLERLAANGLTLNREKCTFALEQVRFFRQISNKDGVLPDSEKIKAITDMDPPSNRE